MESLKSPGFKYGVGTGSKSVSQAQINRNIASESSSGLKSKMQNTVHCGDP